ncbi:hypothetical protein NSQ95_12145 [Psychrobacillus sp. FSL W7-1457]|uniref:hypothetical protein n=1 Tax=Psychrobacillus sp. FSL W7-1457 TaxID=2954547 RepID=UPI00315B26FC
MFHLFKNISSSKENIESKVDRIYEDDDLGVGILIHFTPIATYMYLSTDILIEKGDTLYDSKRREIIVEGNSVSITLNNRREIPEIIDLYGLNNLDLPLITIEVTLSY